MKNLQKYARKGAAIGAVCAIVFGFFACGPSAESMLKKYGSYPEVEPLLNKGGVSIAAVGKQGDENGVSFTVAYAHPLLGHVDEYVQTLANRWTAANAQNPSETWPIETVLSVDSLDRNEYGLPVYGTVITLDPDAVKARFVLLGFKGIGKEESEELETPSLFYLVDVTDENPRILTEMALVGDEIFPPDYSTYRFSAGSIRIQQLIGSWGRTGGSYKTDYNEVFHISTAITFTVDSAYQVKPALVFGKGGAFSSTIDYSNNETLRFYKYTKSLRIGQNDTWVCENVVEGVPGEDDYLFSCDLKITPVCEEFNYRLTLVENDVLRLEFFEKPYLPEEPDDFTGFIMKGGVVPIYATLEFRRL